MKGEEKGLENEPRSSEKRRRVIPHRSLLTRRVKKRLEPSLGPERNQEETVSPFERKSRGATTRNNSLELQRVAAPNSLVGVHADCS